MNFSLELINIWSLFSHFINSIQAEKMIVDCVCALSCIHLSCFHSDLNYLLCVLRELHADSPVGGITKHLVCFVQPDNENSGHGLVPFIVSLP